MYAVRIVLSSFNSIQELKIGYACLQSNLVISKPVQIYICKIIPNLS